MDNDRVELETSIDVDFPLTHEHNYFGMVYGYLGPCPGRPAHTYEFMLYAIDVAALPVATTALSATVSPVILMHDLAMAPLTGSATTVP